MPPFQNSWMAIMLSTGKRDSQSTLSHKTPLSSWVKCNHISVNITQYKVNKLSCDQMSMRNQSYQTTAATPTDLIRATAAASSTKVSLQLQPPAAVAKVTTVYIWKLTG